MRTFSITGVVVGLLLSPLFVSWTNSTEMDKAAPGDIFIYEFHEPLHCNNINYKITVTQSKTYFAIDAYGTVVYTDSSKIALRKYNDFVKAVTALHITSRERTDGPCVGSVSEYFQFYAGTSKQLKGMYSTCSPGFSNLAGDLPAAAALFKALIPRLEKTLDKIREEQSDKGPCD